MYSYRLGVLNYQNAARSLLGQTNLTWSATLANLTEHWANKCVFADSGTYGGFIHGSNAAAFAGSNPTGYDCAQSWVDERPYYLGGTITEDGSFCQGGNADNCGHYTQVSLFDVALNLLFPF